MELGGTKMKINVENKSRWGKELKKTSVRIALTALFISACAVAGILMFCYWYPNYSHTNTPLNFEKVVASVGLIFSVVGVIATVFFVVLSFRAELIYDDIKSAGQAITKRMEREKETYQRIAYETYVTFSKCYSRLINEDSSQIDKYELEIARMACNLTYLSREIRLEAIDLLATIDRGHEEKNNIKNDIELLEKILLDVTEEEDIRKAARKSLKTIE